MSGSRVPHGGDGDTGPEGCVDLGAGSGGGDDQSRRSDGASALAGQVLAVDRGNAEAEGLLAAPTSGGEIPRLTILFADLVDSNDGLWSAVRVTQNVN